MQFLAEKQRLWKRMLHSIRSDLGKNRIEEEVSASDGKSALDGEREFPDSNLRQRMHDDLPATNTGRVFSQ